ncbi:MAG: DUF4230 domain-containing protein [Polyangiaceae bacterium]|nr:DUF4230 domain-containing protein [Polyangiaceae bacterium]
MIDGKRAGWVVGAMVLLAVGVGIGAASRGLDLSSPLLSGRATRSVTVIRATPNVVTAIRDLSRLESAEYHLERVLDVRDQQSRAFGLIEAEDALLLVAAGDVIAGVDLSKLGERDVRVDHSTRSVRVTLPPPTLLSARLDADRTYVHSRKTDLLATHAPRLEGDARARAEKELSAAALEAGILDKAAKNARRTVEDLLRALGFTTVEVEVRSA